MKQQYILKTHFLNETATFQIGGQGEYRTIDQALEKATKIAFDRPENLLRIEVIRLNHTKNTSKVSCVVRPKFHHLGQMYSIKSK